MMRVLFVIVAVGLTIVSAQHPTVDRGAAGAWHKILKLQTTASAMHTTAHPDDEHGGVLALLSRGQGARVSLLTLTRGESGDNAIGPELFDALGLIRTEELLLADEYYGVDRQYFTTAVDYGFSKRLDEALDKWGTEHVLRDMVRIIRTERPMILISRFQGTERDGHGNHMAAGLLTQQAFKAAGDPKMFPDQVAAGLQAWQPLKVYIGGVRQNDDWTIRVDAGTYDAILGDSYQTFARRGLSFQRSQNGGRFVPQRGPSLSFYKRVGSVVDGSPKEETFFEGIDTTIAGIYRALRKTPEAGADEQLSALQRELTAAQDAFSFSNPAASVPALARALAIIPTARDRITDTDVKFVLDRKDQQIRDAIHAALGVTLTATAQPSGTPESTSPFAGPVTMGPVVPGQTFDARLTFLNPSRVALTTVRLSVEYGAAKPGSVSPAAASDARPNEPIAQKFSLTVPEDAPLTRPHFSRHSIQDARYTVEQNSRWFDAAAPEAFHATAEYTLPGGTTVMLRSPITRLEANLPYGYETRALEIVPALSITLSPSHAVAPLGRSPATISLNAEVLNNVEGNSEGTLTLKTPAGWNVTPATHSFQFTRAGERSLFSFTIGIPAAARQEYRVEAVATSRGREYREGYSLIRHRDLATRYLYRDATTTVRGVDVVVRRGLRVGYVMGIGDEVPAGLAQLGADVELLGANDLATGNLSRFNSIITGTRAYAVRTDLKTYNRRLLDYVENGGNLIVLYNTQELAPKLYAPYPGELPANAEEVSEEDSPVEILATDDPVFTTPNRITRADFAGWVEQRGSKFWTTWDPRYTAMIATWDKGQTPQKGGWLHARYGKGHYTYFAYAFHRQLPYGVAGAYRLLANLLSLNTTSAVR
jgi:LmbE family N-acetylglucosaminyl deacetylase